MKKILLLSGLVLTMFGGRASAQTFVLASASDTIYASANSLGAVPGATDFIKNVSASHPGLVLKWTVIGTNFPADWLTQSAFGICDNNVCRYNVGDTSLWNNTTQVGTTITTAPYLIDSSMTFDLSLSLPTASTGIHWVTVQIDDHSLTPPYSRRVTFIISNGVTGVTPVTRSTDDVVLYPNPAKDEVNIVYDANADVKNIAVYNIIGKLVTVYKVTANNSANLDISNLSSGIYFVRLMNSRGGVVVTRKFTKQ